MTPEEIVAGVQAAVERSTVVCVSPREYAPGIWAGVAQPVNLGVTLTLGDRVVDVTGQTNEEIAETAARMISGEVLP